MGCRVRNTDPFLAQSFKFPAVESGDSEHIRWIDAGIRLTVDRGGS